MKNATDLSIQIVHLAIAERFVSIGLIALKIQSHLLNDFADFSTLNFLTFLRTLVMCGMNTLFSLFRIDQI